MENIFTGTALFLWCIFSIASIIIYHKIFAVFYFDILNGIFKEVCACAFAGVILTALALKFSTPLSIILAIVGILISLKVERKGTRILIIILFILMGISVYSTGHNIYNKSEDTFNASSGSITEFEHTEENLKEENPQKIIFLTEFEKIEKYSKENLDNEEDDNKIKSESIIVFNKWDKLLNDIYQYLKSTMPNDEFATLEKDEIDWIVQKEESIKIAQNTYTEETEKVIAGTGMAIVHTKDRCKHLIDLIE